MESWKEYGQNPVTHSAAHHLVAIDKLTEEFGYARVTDVAKRLAITRGSASITLKNLRTRGLVDTDARGFLRLSGEGLAIVRGVRAKKSVMKKLFAEILGIDEEQANIDACKIEHLVSGAAVERITHLLRFLESGRPEAKQFLRAFEEYDEACGMNPKECAICDADCLATEASVMEDGKAEKAGGTER